jgi:hypothetical protein
LKVSAFFEGDGSAAENLPADVAVYEGCGSGDGAEKLDAGTFFHAQFFAGYLTNDFPVAADDEVA